MLKPSKFDRTKWGCPRCEWPLDRDDDMGDGGVTCACGAWVPLPDEDPPRYICMSCDSDNVDASVDPPVCVICGQTAMLYEEKV